MRSRSPFAGFVVLSLGLAAVVAVLFHAPATSSALSRGNGPDITVLDGSLLTAGFGPLPASTSSPSESLLSATDAPVVVSDGWTMRLGDSRNQSFFDAECYSFSSPTTNNNRILFNVNLKVPRAGIPNELWGDLVIFACNPRIGSSTGGEDMPPVPSRAIFFDDIRFGNPGSAADPYQVVGFVRMDTALESIPQLGGPGTFDWMLLTDSSATNAGDDDGNGSPDVCVEVTSSGVGFKLRPSCDELGGSAIEVFAGNVRRINVFEPAGNFPPVRAGFAGSQAGETGSTRPWCFRIQ
jgi:hypothetical protein